VQVNLPDGTHAWAERREGQTAWEAAEAFIEGRGERRAEVSGYREQLASLLGGSSAPMPAPEGLPRTCLADLVDACGSVVDVAGGIFDRSPPCWAPPAVPIDVDSRPDRACLAVGNAAQSPRHVFIFWAQGFHDVPWFVPHVVSSWRRRNPNWKVYLLSESDIGRVVEIDGGMITRFGDDLVAMSEVLRINLLRDHGGVWADATLLSLRSLDDWLTGVELGRDFGRSGFFAFERPRLGQFGRPAADEVLDNWFFYADPRDDRVRRALSAVVAAMEDYWRDRLVKDEYFWLFDVFIRVHRENPDFQHVWDATPRLGAADGPLVFHLIQSLTRTIGACDWDMLDDLDPPVIKVSYKLDARLINACTPHCVLQEAVYLAGRADRRPKTHQEERPNAGAISRTGAIVARAAVRLRNGDVREAVLREGQTPLQAAASFFETLGQLDIDYRGGFCTVASLLAEVAERHDVAPSRDVSPSKVEGPGGRSGAVEARAGRTAREVAGERLEGQGAAHGGVDLEASAEFRRRAEADDRLVAARVQVNLPDGTHAWAERREGQTAWEAAEAFIEGLGEWSGEVSGYRARLAGLLGAEDWEEVVASVLVEAPDGNRSWMERREGQSAWEAAEAFLEPLWRSGSALASHCDDLARRLGARNEDGVVARVRTELLDGSVSLAEIRESQTAWEAAGAFLAGLNGTSAGAPGRAELAERLDAADRRSVVARAEVELDDGSSAWAEQREGQSAWAAAEDFLAWRGPGARPLSIEREMVADLLETADLRPVVARAFVAHEGGWVPVVQREGESTYLAAGRFKERTGAGWPSLSAVLQRLAVSESSPTNLFPRSSRSTYAPFIWDVEDPTWYTVEPAEEVAGPGVERPPLGTIHMSKQHVVELANLSCYTVDTHTRFCSLTEAAGDPVEMVAALRREEDELPRLPRVAHFEDVWVSPTGWIVDGTRYEHAVRNGGPEDLVSWNPPETARELDDVITTATRWSSSPFHFAMESMVGLTVPGLDTSTAWIHVSKKNEFVHEWLEMTLGVPASRVVDGVILAKRLRVPEMARATSPSGLELGRLRVSLRLPPRSPEASDEERTVLLMRRNFFRPLKDPDEVERIVRTFADRIGARLVHHDDRSLPSVPEQLDAFRRASVVVGPHGAAELNLIAAEPGTCVVEISPPASNVPVLLYPRISALLGLHHWTVASVDGVLVRPEDLAEALDECYGRHIGARSVMG